MLDHLGKFKGSLDVVNKMKQTAIFSAVTGNKPEILKYLLKELKMDTNAQDINKRTALHLTCKEKKPNSIKLASLLIEEGADVTKKLFTGKQYFTKLHFIKIFHS